MLIVGHTLAWHSQTPRWVFQDENGRALSGTNAADRQLLLQRLHDHIATVVGRYKGRIKIWDVVNEALNNSGSANDTNMLRQSSPCSERSGSISRLAERCWCSPRSRSAR